MSLSGDKRIYVSHTLVFSSIGDIRRWLDSVVTDPFNGFAFTPTYCVKLEDWNKISVYLRFKCVLLDAFEATNINRNETLSTLNHHISKSIYRQRKKVISTIFLKYDFIFSWCSVVDCFIMFLSLYMIFPVVGYIFLCHFVLWFYFCCNEIYFWKGKLYKENVQNIESKI